MADPIKASFDVPFENPLWTVPMTQQDMALVPWHRHSGVPAESHRNGRRLAILRWDRDPASKVLAWPGRSSWGCPKYTTASSRPPSGFVTITHPHHPLRGQRVEIVRLRRGNDPDLIVVLPDGRHAAIALSSTDYASPPESPPTSGEPSTCSTSMVCVRSSTARSSGPTGARHLDQLAIASGRNRPNRGSITSPDPHSGYLD